MPAPDFYQQVLKSYEENPKVQILRKIRGAKALKAFGQVMGVAELNDWLATWSAAEKGAARGFLYIRKLRKNIRYGVKMVAPYGTEHSVLGHEVPEPAGEALLAKFNL